MSWQFPSEVLDELLRRVSKLSDLEGHDTSRIDDRNAVIKECEQIRSEHADRHKAHVQSKCDELVRNIRKYMEEREADINSRAKVLQDLRKADAAFQAQPQDASSEETDELRTNLFCLYVMISEMDTNLMCIAIDEQATRAALDAYLKVMFWDLLPRYSV